MLKIPLVVRHHNGIMYVFGITYYSVAIPGHFTNTSILFSQDGVHATPSKLKAIVMRDPTGPRT